MKQNIFYGKKSSLYALILFLFSPIIAILGVILNKDLNAAKVVIPCFFALLGYTFALGDGGDVYKLLNKFDLFLDYSFREFSIYLFSVEGNLKDEGIEIFITSLSYLVGLFTSNNKILLMVYGFILGIITMKVVELIYYLPTKSKNNLFTTILFCFIVMWNLPVNSINGRFYLAFWFYLFAVLSYLRTSNWKYLIISTLSVPIHQGYLLGVGILIIWSLTRRLRFRNYLYLSIFTITLVIPSNSGLNYLQQVDTSIVPNSHLQEKIEGYTRDEYVDIIGNTGSSRSALWNIYAKAQPFLQLAISLVLVQIFLFMRNKNNSLNLDFMYFITLFYSFVNYFYEVPSLGGRYTNILLAISTIFIYLVESEGQIKIFKPLKVLLFIALFFSFLVKFRVDIEHLNAFAIITPTPLLLVGVPDQSFVELLKSLF